MREAERAGAPPGPTARIQWGIPDAALAWVAGVVVSLFVLAPFVNDAGDLPLRREAEATAAGIAAQAIAVIAVLYLIARAKGLGSLDLDFGLVVRLRDIGPRLAAGAAVSLAGFVMLVPLEVIGDFDEVEQGVAEVLSRSSGAERAFVLLGAIVIAPLAEELLFRGVLLRGLLRRLAQPAAIWVSAGAFALVHPLGDLDTAYGIPIFLLLGLVSGWRATVSGELSQSICIHAGFNLVSSIGILV